MWQERPKHYDKPEKKDCEGWLYSEQQEKLCQFKPDTPSAHAPMDCGADLQLQTTSTTCTYHTPSNAQA